MARNITRTAPIEPLARLFILRLHKVLTMDRTAPPLRCRFVNANFFFIWLLSRNVCLGAEDFDEAQLCAQEVPRGSPSQSQPTRSALHICVDHTSRFCGRTDGGVPMDAFLARRSASVGAKPVHTHRSDAVTFCSASFHSSMLTTSI